MSIKLGPPETYGDIAPMVRISTGNFEARQGFDEMAQADPEGFSTLVEDRRALEASAASHEPNEQLTSEDLRRSIRWLQGGGILDESSLPSSFPSSARYVGERVGKFVRGLIGK